MTPQTRRIEQIEMTCLVQHNHCVFSSDRVYRYTLEHKWGEHSQYIAWIGLNPSTADETQLDPTLRRITGFSKQFGFSRFIMLNLFAYRATDPADMRSADNPVGPDNDQHVLRVAQNASMVVAAWGAQGAYLGRSLAVKQLLKDVPMHCLNQCKSGEPAHPLYLRGELVPKLFQNVPQMKANCAERILFR